MTEFRRVTDETVLLKWRSEVLEHVFGSEPAADIIDANRTYYRRHVADGTHLAFVAIHDGAEAGCGAVCFYEEMPSPDNPTGQCAYLMNIYVRKPYRSRGIGSAIVRRLVSYSRPWGAGRFISRQPNWVARCMTEPVSAK